MSYGQYELEAEILRHVTDAVDKGAATSASWIAHQVHRVHRMPAKLFAYELTEPFEWRGNDRDFHEVSASYATRDLVRKQLGKLKRDQDEDKEALPRFPGWDRLQAGYIITRKRGGKIDFLVVPIEQMSKRELLAKADDYDRMADGCREHAQELRRYATTRPDDKEAA